MARFLSALKEERVVASQALNGPSSGSLVHDDRAAFVNDIQARPTERLISDLPGLLALTPAKNQLVVMVLRKKAQPDGAEGSALIQRLTDPTIGASQATFPCGVGGPLGF